MCSSNSKLSFLFSTALGLAATIVVVHGQPGGGAVPRQQGLGGGGSRDADCILGADIFTPNLEILSAAVGFDGSIGVGPTEEDAVQHDLAWDYDRANLDICPITGADNNPGTASSAIPKAVVVQYDCAAIPNAHDGFPICFSWPVLPCSIQREHILYERSDGSAFHPNCISSVPNEEFNERHCLVMFDDFINRQLPGEPNRLAMDRIDIVGDLLFVSPRGEIVSGKGLSRIAPPDETPYLSGPVFVGARLSPLDSVGEGNADTIVGRALARGNSGIDLYVDAKTGANNTEDLHRLRLFYSGGMTIDGLNALRPDLFGDYFVLQFGSGDTIEEDNVTTEIANSGTAVTVMGMADLGPKQEEGYDICYDEDRDNYIDIILSVDGDDLSVLDDISVLAFTGGKSLYNPGGPGPTPFDGVRYTAPAPSNQVVPVLVDLDNQHQTTFCLKEDDGDGNDVVWSRNVQECEQWRSEGLLRTVPLTNFGASSRSCPKDLVEIANAGIIAPEAFTEVKATQTKSSAGAGLDTRSPRSIFFSLFLLCLCGCSSA